MIISNGELKAEISERGAHLDSLFFKGRNMLLENYDNSPTHYGAAFLFPYAGRVKDAIYPFDGIYYQLPKNDGENSIHGLVLDKIFSFRKPEENRAVLSYVLDDNAYPSILSVDVEFMVSENTFETDVRVKNEGQKRSPLLIGFHPYFNFGGSWILKPETETKILEYDGYFPTGRMERYNFDDDSFKKQYDNEFMGGGNLVLRGSSFTMTMIRKNMPFFVIYNGKYSKGYSLAVEPMTGAVDSFNNGIGLIKLDPDEEFECGYSVSFTMM